ncbi:hypothetical protein [Oceanibaculum pacificum]|uniref:Uncharacterized protein n=1 Tax=Oceanibaculum pacificum TaxID=580166 RepID=A0A154WFE2_9PROT|nr:hypothetical protein [Oceanibaculum pacificum]KZD12248.1 hypothetical protein AUP43_16970 [Oceanibaculum pacificum]
MPLCRYLLCLFLLLPAPALAQGEAPTDSQGQPLTPPPPRPNCDLLPGGNAPVDRIARLSGELSVHNLNYTYFGKPLLELTAADFDEMARIVKACQVADTEAPKRLQAFREKVMNANAARQETLRWIRRNQAEIKKMGNGRQDLERLQAMWLEMLARSEEMLPADRAPLARDIVLKQEQIYVSTPVPAPDPVWTPKR